MENVFFFLSVSNQMFVYCTFFIFKYKPALLHGTPPGPAPSADPAFVVNEWPFPSLQ
jgi:hypothetical protein